MKTQISKENSKKLEKYKQTSTDLAAKIQENKKELAKNTTSRSSIIKMAVAFAFVIIFVISLISSLGSYAQNASALELVEVITEDGEIIPNPENSNLPKDLNFIETVKICKVPSSVDSKAMEAIREQIEVANKLKLPIEARNDFGISFRFIPKGKFLMGSPETEANRDDVEFQHKASVDEDLYFSKYEITEKQWKAITGRGVIDSRGPNFPVVNIDLNDAKEFVRLLNEKLDVPEGTYDLATETEWEYACRTWTTTAYFYGDNQDIATRYDFTAESAGKRLPVRGNNYPNAWGLYNMIGNVGEWTKTPFWLYECPDNVYAPSWDQAIYDGDPLGQDNDPLNNFTSTLRAPGSQTGVYFYDELQTGKGKYSKGEFIWKDEEGGKAGVYEFGVDTVIYDGDNKRDFSVYKDIKGLQTDLYYGDANQDGEWSVGEDLWLLDTHNRYSNPEQIFRSGFWLKTVEGSRSASRYAVSPTATSNIIGLRIVRRLHDIESETQTDNDTITSTASSISQ